LSPPGYLNMTLWYNNAAAVAYLHSELLQASDIFCIFSGGIALIWLSIHSDLEKMKDKLT